MPSLPITACLTRSSALNLRSLKGVAYPIGSVFSTLAMPADSPYRHAWWYRTEVDLPAAETDRTWWLQFDGINYRANVWLNGVRVASATEVRGAFRRYAFDVSRVVRAGKRNALAVEIFPPQPNDLAINWVDWNPTPPDKNMGLWGSVSLTTTGPVALRHPYVLTDLNSPTNSEARLTAIVEAVNASDRRVDAVLSATIDNVHVSRTVSLAPHEQQTVRMTPADHPELILRSPRVWWPYRMGEPALYVAQLDVTIDGQVSDRREITFGVRRVTSELTAQGHRLFKINGRPILIRGGGWSPDMLLRPITTDRLRAEMRYVREMGLNTIRLEGKLETDEFFDLADREGVLVMAGWCCCDQWELWDKWTADNYTVGPLSLRDQLLRLRSSRERLRLVERQRQASHPCRRAQVPRHRSAARVEQPDALERRGGTGHRRAERRENARTLRVRAAVLLAVRHQERRRVRLRHRDQPRPGGPTAREPSRDADARHLWPIDRVWNYHAGGGEFKTIDKFTSALEARYGKAEDASDYARKAQALTYDGQRAMFEAYARNKYTATGVVQWMLNNAWPSLIWHLYDYYLRPGGGYFGTKKACEPVHVQYSYDDRSIALVNDTPTALAGVTVSASVLDFGLATRFSREARVDLPADGVVRAFTLPEVAGLTTTYFLRLSARDTSGAVISTNFYWLSTQEDRLDWSRTEWYFTPTTRHADLTMLSRLPMTTIAASIERRGDREVVAVQNAGTARHFRCTCGSSIRRRTMSTCRCSGMTITSRCCQANGERSACRASDRTRPGCAWTDGMCSQPVR